MGRVGLCMRLMRMNVRSVRRGSVRGGRGGFEFGFGEDGVVGVSVGVLSVLFEFGAEFGAFEVEDEVEDEVEG